MRIGVKIMKFSKFLALALINSITFGVQAIDVAPKGKLIRKSPFVSKNPTVQMYFDENNTPVVNVTPGRPTVVQFPTEVRSCATASALIKITYADKTSPNTQGGSGGTTTTTTGETSWYSAAIVNVDMKSIENLSTDKILKMPSTVLTCQLRISSPDSINPNSYTWESVGIKISNPEDTYLVVYLLDSNSDSSNGLPSEQDLEDKPYIDIKKLELKKIINTLNKSIEKSLKLEEKKDLTQKKTKEVEPQSQNKSSILDFYSFKETKEKPKLPDTI